MVFKIENGVLLKYTGKGRKVVIPDGVTSIGDCAFVRCWELTSVTIPDSVTKIGFAAFEECSSLKSITIPDSVTSIEGRAFSECKSLTSVTIPDSVTSIGRDAFSYTEWLEERRKENPLVIASGILIDGRTCKGEVTIPDGVTSIGVWAFSECKSLTSVTIPDSVTSIGERAFSECKSLTSVTIPDSVTSIGDWTFSDCKKLTSVTIPDSVTKIGYCAFYKCSSLTDVIFGKSVTSIDLSCCTALTSITIPDNVTSIDLVGCTGLTSITIPDKVTSINLRKCTGLTSLHWVGRCNVTGFTCGKKVGNKINEALTMVESKDFAVKLETGIKVPFIVGMYRETKDADAFAYLKKNFSKLMTQYITDGDVENVTFFLEETELFTKKNIDKFLELAIAQEQHEIYTLLVNYKAEKLGFKDIKDQFKL